MIIDAHNHPDWHKHDFNAFIKNMDDFAVINGIYSEYFKENCPARACVEVARLPKDVLIEMEAIAVAM